MNDILFIRYLDIRFRHGMPDKSKVFPHAFRRIVGAKGGVSSIRRKVVSDLEQGVSKNPVNAMKILVGISRCDKHSFM